jgi:hypothetical protein
MVKLLKICILIVIMFFSCKSNQNQNNEAINNKNDEEYYKLIETRWNNFVDKCYDECINTNKNGYFFKNGKKIYCDKNYLVLYGRGIMYPEVTPDDICANNQKLWDKDPDAFIIKNEPK